MANKKLKVFQAQFGFHDTVVAAPSRAAALRAWGVRQDLFANGEARIVTDPAAVAAAIANPETPLRRPVGSSDPFELEPSRLPKVPDAPQRAAARSIDKVKPSPPLTPIANRSTLDAAEAAMLGVDQRRKREEAELRVEAKALEVRKVAAREAYVKARKAATGMVFAAREAYRKAGGIE